MKKTPRTKKCRNCGKQFNPFSSIAVACSPKCAIDLVEERKEKVARRENKERKKAFYSKDMPLQLKLTEKVINKYARIRDKGKPCISCDKPDNGQHQRHASHYKSVGSNSALRFNLWNIHASCKQCNKDLSGNIGEYTPRLIAKIGQDKYDWLLSQNQTVKYDVIYLQRLRKIFAKKTRRLERIK